MGIIKRMIDLFHPQPPPKRPPVEIDWDENYDWLARQLERMDQDQKRDQRRLEDARQRSREGHQTNH